MLTNRNDEENPALLKILQRKQLSEDLFKPTTYPAITLESDMTDHARWAFDNIYKIPYVGHGIEMAEAKEFDIPRYIHGIQHTSRVAMYVQVFANLYRRHGDKDAATLTDEDIKLLQIGALFHDSARENEGEDKWDHESAIFLYYYLTRILNVDNQKAKLITEATANKDVNEELGYFEINANESGDVSWGYVQPTEAQALNKNIYQKIIHDADCLDIIRARLSFDAQYLDFYKDIVSKQANTLALDEMAYLVAEARSLIDIHGDSYGRTKGEIKKKYESKDAYLYVVTSLDENKHKIISALARGLIRAEELNEYQLLDLTSYQAGDGLTERNMQRALREGLVFARAIGSPSAIAKSNKPERNETLVELELRKTMREVDIATTSSKENRTQKIGNPFRSVSMLGPGAGVYADAGFLVVNPDTSAISKVSATDADTSRGKKQHLVSQYTNESRPAQEQIERELSDLHHQLKVGSKVHQKYGSSHAEILYDMTRCDAVYYTNDPTSHNSWLFGSSFGNVRPLEASHHHSPMLQAIYLQKQYEKQYELAKGDYLANFGEEEGLSRFTKRFGNNKTLPMYEYSGIHNTMRLVTVSELSDEKIIEMWGEMCFDYMKLKFTESKLNDLYEMDITEIKVKSMYKNDHHELVKRNAPADANYSDTLRQRIDQEIEKRKQALIQDYELSIAKCIDSGSLDVFNDEAFNALVRNPFLLAIYKRKVINELQARKDSFASWSPVKFEINKNNKSLAEKMFVLSSQLGLTEYVDYFRDAAISLINRSLADIDNKMHQPSVSEIKNHDVGNISLDKWGVYNQDKGGINLDYLLGNIDKYNNAYHNNSFEVNDPFYVQVINLIKYVEYFGLNESYAQQLDKLLLDMLAHETKEYIHFTEKKDIKKYLECLQKMQMNGLIRSEHITELSGAYQKSCEDLAAGAYNAEYEKFSLRSGLMSHLALARYVAVNMDTLVNDVIKWLKQENEDSRLLTEDSIHELMSGLSEHIVLNGASLPLFQLLIDKISLQRFPGSDNFSFDISNWFKCVGALQDYVKDKEFTDDQLEVISKKWQEAVCDRYIAFINSKAFNDDPEQLAKLAGNLSEFSAHSPRLPLDSLIKVFNDKINSKLEEIHHSKHSDLNAFFYALQGIERIQKQLLAVPGNADREPALNELLALGRSFGNLAHPMHYVQENAELHLRGMQLDCKTIREKLIPFIQSHPDLKVIDFSGSSIFEYYADAEKMKAYAELGAVLSALKSLKTLKLSNCEIGSEGVALLASVLPALHNLTKLDLRNNKIGDEGAEMLNENLPKCLRTVYVSGNEMSDINEKKLQKSAYAADIGMFLTEVGRSEVPEDERHTQVVTNKGSPHKPNID